MGFSAWSGRGRGLDGAGTSSLPGLEAVPVCLDRQDSFFVFLTGKIQVFNRQTSVEGAVGVEAEERVRRDAKPLLFFDRQDSGFREARFSLGALKVGT